jgi:hypothetical protein
MHTAALAALDAVYGSGLCAGALMSTRQGNSRLHLCDCKDRSGHESASSKAHRLPAKSGPSHKESWDKVQNWKSKKKRNKEPKGALKAIEDEKNKEKAKKPKK